MKRLTLTCVVLLMLFLSACGEKKTETPKLDEAQSATLVVQLIAQKLTLMAPTDAPSSTATPEPAKIELNKDYDDAVSVQLQLLAGSFLLEGSSLAVTAEQAKTLLPLWNNFATLTASQMPSGGGQGQMSATPQVQIEDTETQKAIEDLVKQISAVMDNEQLQTIADKKITQEDVQALMEEKDISTQMGSGPGGEGGGGTPPGGGGGGTPPDGGSGGPGGMSGGQMSGSSGGQPQMGEMISSELIKAWIEVLEKKNL